MQKMIQKQELIQNKVIQEPEMSSTNLDPKDLNELKQTLIERGEYDIYSLERCTLTEMNIKVHDENPIIKFPFRKSYYEEKVINEEVEKLNILIKHRRNQNIC